MESKLEVHILPTAQPGQAQPPPSKSVSGPPQSRSVSLPFFRPSVQLGRGAHFMAAQMSDWQSLLAAQPSPTGQEGHAGPPQSTSVSLPSFIPSAQLAGELQTPFLQKPD